MADESLTRQTQLDELKEIVSHTLEKRGVLAKIQAELRSHLFDALMEQENKDYNIVPPQLLKDEFDKVAFALVKEYLSFHHLDYTLALLNVEAQIKSEEPSMERSSVASQIGLRAQKPNPSQTLLKELVTKLHENDMFAARIAGNEGKGVGTKKVASNLILKERQDIPTYHAFAKNSPSPSPSSKKAFDSHPKSNISRKEQSFGNISPTGGKEESSLAGKVEEAAENTGKTDSNTDAELKPKAASDMSLPPLGALPPLNKPNKLPSINASMESNPVVDPLSDLLETDSDENENENQSKDTSSVYDEYESEELNASDGDNSDLSSIDNVYTATT